MWMDPLPKATPHQVYKVAEVLDGSASSLQPGVGFSEGETPSPCPAGANMNTTHM